MRVTTLPPLLLSSFPSRLCRFVTHTQSLNMSLEKSFLRRKYFVAACLESCSILARHPKPGLLLLLAMTQAEAKGRLQKAPVYPLCAAHFQPGRQAGRQAHEAGASSVFDLCRLNFKISLASSSPHSPSSPAFLYSFFSQQQQ